MSKKMVKRSLALGALMAFVITGSAFAESIAGRTADDPFVLDSDVTNGIVNTCDPSKCLYQNGYHGNNGGHSSINADSGERKYWDLANNSITISATENCNTNNKNGNGLQVKGINVIGEANSGLSIDCDGYGIFSTGIIGSEENKIGFIEINSGEHGILVNEKIQMTNCPDLKIFTSSLSIAAGGDAMQFSKDATVKADVINITEADRAIRVAGATVIVEANELNISGVSEEIKVASTATGNLTLKANNKGNINSDIIIGETKVKNGQAELHKGILNVTLGAGATLTGKVVTDDASESASTLTLNGATWDVTGDSNVTTLAGENGNVVINDTEHEVKIGTNSNTGLKVKASEDLTEAIAKGEATLQEVAQTVEIEEGNTSITVETQETDIAGASSLTYNAETGEAGAVVKQVSAKNDAISNAGMALKGHYRAHMNDINKRMGELRMANGEAGVWTRMVRGESEYQDAKMQYNQYQLGYDEKLSVDKRWTVGAAVTFAEGDSNYGYGSTEDKSTAFAIYGSKLNNDGTFVDLIARYAHLESDIDDSLSGKGDYSTNGMSVSAEFGKRIAQGNGLWIEPQVELTYGTVDSADFVLSKTGKEVHVDSMDSFIARVGFSVGKDIKQGNVYARASYLYDFDGETETSFSANGVQGDVVKEDFGGGWWEVGVGANINLSKATYIYADVEKTFGGEVDTKWQWNLGVRYSF